MCFINHAKKNVSSVRIIICYNVKMSFITMVIFNENIYNVKTWFIKQMSTMHDSFQRKYIQCKNVVYKTNVYNA